MAPKVSSWRHMSLVDCGKSMEKFDFFQFPMENPAPSTSPLETKFDSKALWQGKPTHIKQNSSGATIPTTSGFLHPAIDPRFSTDAAPCATTFKTLEASWAGKQKGTRWNWMHYTPIHTTHLDCQTASQRREQKNMFILTTKAADTSTQTSHNQMRTLAWTLCWFLHTPQGPSTNPSPSSQWNVVTCLDQHRGSPTWSLAAHAKCSMMLAFAVVNLKSPTGSTSLKSIWDLQHIITSKLCYRHHWWYIYIYLMISCICTVHE